MCFIVFCCKKKCNKSFRVQTKPPKTRIAFSSPNVDQVSKANRKVQLNRLERTFPDQTSIKAVENDRRLTY